MKVLASIGLTLPFAWLLGLHVMDGARVLALCLVIAFFLKRDALINHSTPPTLFSFRHYSLWFGAFLTAYLAILGSYLWVRVRTGGHGLDFLIFSQVWQFIGDTGIPQSSLIGPGIRNFFAHHFSPLYYLPGLLTYLGLKPWVAGIGLHLVSIGATFVLIYKIARSMGWPRPIAIILTALFACLPTLRHSVFWSFHDETFALPFAVAGWYFYRSKRTILLMASLIMAIFCKETMALWAAFFGLMVLVTSHRDDRAYFESTRWWMVGLILGSIGFLIGYIGLQPFIFQQKFDHVSRIATFRDLLNIEALMGKAHFLLILIIPVLFLPFLNLRRSWPYLLPSLPFIGMVMVSNFAEMWKQLNYYGIIPTMGLFLASLEAINLSRPQLIQSINPLKIAAISLVCCFCWGAKNPTKSVVSSMNQPFLDPGPLATLPLGASMAVSPAAGLFLLDRTPHLRTLASLLHESMPEFVVVKKGEDLVIPSETLAHLKPCHPSTVSQWIVLCKH